MKIKVGISWAKELLANLWYIPNDQYLGIDGSHQLQQLRELGWINLGHWHKAPANWDKKDPFQK